MVFDPSLSTGTLIVNGDRRDVLTRLTTADANPLIEPNTVPAEPLFESVLGVYGHAIRGQRRPFVTLRPPNGDLWTEDIERKLKETLSYAEVDYIGTAKLVIPAEGMYTIDIPKTGTQFRLNGHLVRAGNIKLRKGGYDVEIYTNHWGQPYLKYARAAVFKAGTKTKIPFVNTGDTLETFLSQRINDHAVTEVCRYQPRAVQ